MTAQGEKKDEIKKVEDRKENDKIALYISILSHS